jgi:hypothetical protein
MIFIAEEDVMPLDLNACRENAERCLAAAAKTTDPTLTASLKDTAERWLRLAACVQATNERIEARGNKRFSRAGSP